MLTILIIVLLVLLLTGRFGDAQNVVTVILVVLVVLWLLGALGDANYVTWPHNHAHYGALNTIRVPTARG